MKTFLLALFLLPISLFAQIPNFDFEDWESQGELPERWELYGNHTKTNVRAHGSSAIRLENKANSAVHFGAITNASIQNNLSGGQPYGEIPLVFSFDAKHELAAGDVAQAIIVFRVNGADLAYMDFPIYGSSNDTFIRYSVPIIWALTTPPDTAIVVLASNNISSTSSNGDGYVIFDNIVLHSITHTNTPIINADFELWQPSGIQNPVSWYTTDNYIQDALGITEPLNSVVPSSEAHHSVGLLLQNKEVDGGLVTGLAVTGDAFREDFPPTFSVSQKWANIQGYYKFEQDNGDTGSVTAIMYFAGNVAGIAEAKFAKTQSDFAYFSAPVNYFFPVTPDSATLFISSANFDNPKGNETKLWVDKLSFSNSVGGVANMASDIVCYPNPVNSMLTIRTQFNATRFVITDMLGKVVIISKSPKIDVSSLQKGSYMLRIESDNSTLRSKFVKS